MEEHLTELSCASSQQKWKYELYKVSTASERPLENETQCIMGGFLYRVLCTWHCIWQLQPQSALAGPFLSFLTQTGIDKAPLPFQGRHFWHCRQFSVRRNIHWSLVLRNNFNTSLDVQQVPGAKLKVMITHLYQSASQPRTQVLSHQRDSTQHKLYVQNMPTLSRSANTIPVRHTSHYVVTVWRVR